APIYTHQGLLSLIQDPSISREEIVGHLNQLITDANLINQQNAELQAQIENQAQIFQNQTDGPIVTMSAAIRSLAAGHEEARRLHLENQRTQESYQASVNEILAQLSARSNTPIPAPLGYRLSTPIPFAEKFKGAEGDLSFTVFKAQLKAQMVKFPHAFTNDSDKVTYAFQCMSGAPARYFAMLYSGQQPDTLGLMTNYPLFLDFTDKMFGDHNTREDCEHKLARLRQANGTFHDYLIRFRELSSRTEWNDAALLARFKDGLSIEIKNVLMAQWSKLSTIEDTIAAATIAAQNLKMHKLF
ncbi:Retrotransposon-derived protein peg10, partial [Linnemannia zychae]